jgi:multidrug transporter EmrE-like cation transporter
MFSYLILILSYSIILTDKNISIIYPILKVLSVIVVVIFGIFIFKNSLDMKTIFGIFLGIMSIYILSNKINK